VNGAAAIPALPGGWGVWLSGTATFGSAGRSNAFDFTTDGITLGADRALGDNLLFGVAGSLARNTSELDDDRSRMDADQRSIAFYGLWRAGDHLFVDAVTGAGRLDFDVQRWSADANALATARRSGRQWYAATSLGYEHRGPSLTLAGYGRVDASRTTLDAYRETGLGLFGLDYRRQVIENGNVAIGLEGSWMVGGPDGRVRPFWTVEYRNAFTNRGDAAINYVVGPDGQDYRLHMAGLYPLNRMISIYATLRGFGAPATIAFAGQVIVAATSLTIIGAAVRRKMSATQQLALAVIGSLLISPYAYDYDLPIYGIGLALLMPHLLRLATERELGLLFGLSFFTGLWGQASSFAIPANFSGVLPNDPNDYIAPSPAGLTLVLSVVLIWRILQRDRRRSGAEIVDPSSRALVQSCSGSL